MDELSVVYFRNQGDVALAAELDRARLERRHGAPDAVWMAQVAAGRKQVLLSAVNVPMSLPFSGPWNTCDDDQGYCGWRQDWCDDQYRVVCKKRRMRGKRGGRAGSGVRRVGCGVSRVCSETDCVRKGTGGNAKASVRVVGSLAELAADLSSGRIVCAGRPAVSDGIGEVFGI